MNFCDTVARDIHDISCGCKIEGHWRYFTRAADTAIAVFVKRLRERYTADATDFADELEAEGKP